MTIRYARAIEQHNLAIARFLPVQEAYRARQCDDAAYLAARRAMKEATAAFDAEYAIAAGWDVAAEER